MTALEEKSGNCRSRSDSSCRDQECLYQEFLPIHLVDVEIFHLKKRPKSRGFILWGPWISVKGSPYVLFRYFLDMCRETLLVWLNMLAPNLICGLASTSCPVIKSPPCTSCKSVTSPPVHSASPFSSLLTVNGQMEAKTRRGPAVETWKCGGVIYCWQRATWQRH